MCLCFCNIFYNLLIVLKLMVLSNIQYYSPIDNTLRANLTNYELNYRYFYAKLNNILSVLLIHAMTSFVSTP